MVVNEKEIFLVQNLSYGQNGQVVQVMSGNRFTASSGVFYALECNLSLKVSMLGNIYTCL